MLGIGVILGFVIGVVCSFIYIRTRNKSVLTEREKIIFRLAESSRDIIYHYQVKPEIKWKYMSPSVDWIMGDGRRDYGYKNPNAVFENIHPDDYKLLEDKINGRLDFSKPIMQRWTDKTGDYRWFEEYATPIYEKGELVAIEGIIRDVTDKVNLESELEYRITHDTLTSLFNREYFEQCMQKYDKYVDTSVALILCDLDELKMMNDVRGHQAGDKLIREASKLLCKFSSDNSIVSRIGGDEFAILLTSISEVDVQAMIENITKENLEQNLNSTDITIQMSKGYAYSEKSIGKMESLFVEVDKKMYHDKSMRKSYLPM